VKLVICDNQRILAEALAAALEARGHRVAVTTTTADGLDAVSVCQPDVCLLDLQFGDQPSGLDAACAIRQWYPGTRVLVLSGVTDPETLSQVVGSGVAGFIRKDQSVDQIATALDVIAAGGCVLDPGLPRVRARGRTRPQPRNPLDGLSPREKEIVARITGGQSTRQMAFAMNITVGTVRTYVKNVLAKLGAHSRLQLAALASQDGLLIDQTPASAVLAPTGVPMAWSRGESVLQNGLSGDGDGDHTLGAAENSGAHRRPAAHLSRCSGGSAAG
jgi:two-component system, NarL family, nitrate/nitrite response regulator NarL